MTGQNLLGRRDPFFGNSTQNWTPKSSPNETKGCFNGADPDSREMLGAPQIGRVGAADQPIPLPTDTLPLRIDKGGVIRVGRSRISLDLVVEQYENGMTPEDMVRAYDTLVLADVHAVIPYYLRNRDQVRAYLKRQEEEAEALRATIDAEHPPITREELLARRRAREKSDAPAGQ